MRMSQTILFCRNVLIAMSALILSSCASFHQLASNVSNKNADMPKTQATTQSAGVTSTCNNWCHNGWCSTHCENTTPQQ